MAQYGESRRNFCDSIWDLARICISKSKVGPLLVFTTVGFCKKEIVMFEYYGYSLAFGVVYLGKYLNLSEAKVKNPNWSYVNNGEFLTNRERFLAKLRASL